MRQGIVATSVLVLTLTLASWIVGGAETDDPVERPDASSLASAAISTRSTDPATSVPAAPAPVPVVLTPETDPSSTDATEFLAAINARRAEESLPPLERRPELDLLARSWAATMGVDGSLRHSTLIHDLIAGPWTVAGENVAYGPSATTVFGALEASPGHLANMLGSDYTAVGIGVVRAGERVWTAHLFAG